MPYLRRIIAPGSPPHTRGKVKAKNVNESGLGITPAYAGKSAFAIFPSPNSWDHPRIRGEKRR